MRHPPNLSADPLNPRKLRESHTRGEAQCLSRRIAHPGTLTRQIEGWADRRNAARPQIKWQFIRTPAD